MAFVLFSVSFAPKTCKICRCKYELLFISLDWSRAKTCPKGATTAATNVASAYIASAYIPATCYPCSTVCTSTSYFTSFYISAISAIRIWWYKYSTVNTSSPTTTICNNISATAYAAATTNQTTLCIKCNGATCPRHLSTKSNAAAATNATSLSTKSIAAVATASTGNLSNECIATTANPTSLSINIKSIAVAATTNATRHLSTKFIAAAATTNATRLSSRCNAANCAATT